jgi:hypothetical protein
MKVLKYESDVLGLGPQTLLWLTTVFRVKAEVLYDLTSPVILPFVSSALVGLSFLLVFEYANASSPGPLHWLLLLLGTLFP